jgi:hypothetical protein
MFVSRFYQNSNRRIVAKELGLVAIAVSLSIFATSLAQSQVVEIPYNAKFYIDSLNASRPFQQLEDWQKPGAIKSAATVFAYRQCREPGSADRELAMSFLQLRAMGIGAGLGASTREGRYENAIAFAIGHLMLDSDGSRTSHACRFARENWR